MVRNKKQFGYSDIRLWSFYGIASGLILLLGTFLDFDSSVLIVVVPSVLFVIWFKKHDKTTWVDRFREIDAYVARHNAPKPKKPIVASKSKKPHPKRTSHPLVSLAS